MTWTTFHYRDKGVHHALVLELPEEEAVLAFREIAGFWPHDAECGDLSCCGTRATVTVDEERPDVSHYRELGQGWEVRAMSREDLIVLEVMTG